MNPISVKIFFPLAILILVLNSSIGAATAAYYGYQDFVSAQVHSALNLVAIALLLVYRQRSACIAGTIF